MNYTQHILIGVGTAGLTALAGRAIGLPRPAATTLLTGAAVIAAGAIAVDIDHPRSFVSSGLLLEILDRLLPLVVLVAVLAAALLAGASPPLRFGRSRRSQPGQPLARYPLENVATSQAV